MNQREYTHISLIKKLESKWGAGVDFMSKDFFVLSAYVPMRSYQAL